MDLLESPLTLGIRDVSNRDDFILGAPIALPTSIAKIGFGDIVSVRGEEMSPTAWAGTDAVLNSILLYEEDGVRPLLAYNLGGAIGAHLFISLLLSLAARKLAGGLNG